jgi:predicted transcriptional regulator
VLSAFLALGLLFLFLYLYNRRKRLLMQKEEEVETLRNMLNNSNSSAPENVQQLMLRQLGLIKTIAGSPTEANQQLLAQLTSMDENKASSLMDWESIYRTIDVAYNGFHKRVVEKYGEVLNEKEIQLCCLLKAGFSTKEINMLTRQSLQTIYQRKTQVRQKLGLAEGEDIARPRGDVDGLLGEPHKQELQSHNQQAGNGIVGGLQLVGLQFLPDQSAYLLGGVL